MSVQAKPYITPEEYLVQERVADYKSEYYPGEIFAFAGASREHNLIAGNIYSILHRQLRNKSCEIYPGDMRVKVCATGLYAFPDIVIVCGKPQLEGQ